MGVVEQMPRAVIHLAVGGVVAAAQAAVVVADGKAVVHRRNVLPCHPEFSMRSYELLHCAVYATSCKAVNIGHVKMDLPKNFWIGSIEQHVIQTQQILCALSALRRRTGRVDGHTYAVSLHLCQEGLLTAP